MSGITFLSDNLVNDAELSIVSGGENSQFPLENIKNESTAIKFRSTTNTTVIVFDLGVTSNIDIFAMTGDATSQLGVSNMSFRTSTTTDFSSSPIYTMSISAEHNFGYVEIDEVTHRYVEMTLTGSGSFAEVSNIFIGSKLNIPQNSLSIASFQYETRDNSRVTSNRYGQKFIDHRNLVKTISGTIEHCTKDETEILDDMFQSHGRSIPLWMLLDTTNTSMNDSEYRLSMYGYLDLVPGWSASGGQTYTTRIVMVRAV